MKKHHILKALEFGRLEWRKHALERMLMRGISRFAVKEAIRNGDVIEMYPDDKPFESVLLVHFMNDKPLHVVVSFDKAEEMLYVITAYIPDRKHFEADYRTRRKHD